MDPEEELEAALLQLKEVIRADNDQFSAVASSVAQLLDFAKELGGMNEAEAEILQQCRDQVKGLTGL